MIKAPGSITYTSVLKIETVRLTLVVAALNNLEVKLGDILNAPNVSLQTPVTEKVWTILCLGYGKNAIKTAVIVRALYFEMSHCKMHGVWQS